MFDRQLSPTLAEPHPSFKEGLGKLPWKTITLVTISLAASITLIALVAAEDLPCLAGDEKKGEKSAGKYQMVIVGNLLIFFIAMVISGSPPEITLFFAGAVAVLTGGLDAGKLFKGGGMESVATLGLLFPIMKAMGDTGVPDKFIGFMMGNPKTLRMAVMRMFVPVALMSAFFNNTPIVVLMLPSIMNFCQRLNLDHRAMLMPLSYAAQSGGNLTLMGTGINFVAKLMFARGGFEIGFFTLSLGGAIIVAEGAIYCSFMGPIMLAKKQEAPALATPVPQRSTHEALTKSGNQAEEAPEEGNEMDEVKSMVRVQAQLGKKNLFNVAILVQPGSNLIGLQVIDCGIHRIKGVHLLHRAFRGVDCLSNSTVELEQTTRQELSEANLRQNDRELSACQRSSFSRDRMESFFTQVSPPLMDRKNPEFQVIADGWQALQTLVLKAGDVMQIAATAEGITALRRVHGLVLGNDLT